MANRNGKNILFGTILILIFLFIVEGLLSIFLYRKSGPEKLASIETLKSFKKWIGSRQAPQELDHTNHKLVRPDSSDEVNLKIAHESVKSNRFVYASWVEFRNADFAGEYMNMAGPIRKSVPSLAPGKRGDTVDIYFFGGSTTFGFNVLDYETIPSQILQLYQEKYPDGPTVRVTNYGTPTYYSFQELMLFANLIYENHRPDIAVFLDGINDFWFGKASYYDQSYFSYVFRQLFNRGLRTEGEFSFVDSVELLFRDPVDMPAQAYHDQLIRHYVRNMNNIRLMADMINSDVYFFLQPSPFYNYPRQQEDPMCFKDRNTRFDYIYPALEKKGDSLYHFTFLGNMLQNEGGYPFVDGLHYSPDFIRKIADRMLERLKPAIFGEEPNQAHRQ